MIHLRNGDNTLEDWVLLCSRNVSKLNKFNVSFINTAPVRLASADSVVVENNYSRLMPLNKSVYTIRAVHNSSKAAKF